VLFFEFFPLVLAIISAIVVLRLMFVDREARNNPSERTPHKVAPPRPPGDRDAERGGVRPSARG
jgi:hypothetical protein